MTRIWMERILWTITLVAAVATLAMWRARRNGPLASGRFVLPAIAPALARLTLDSLENAVSDINDGNLFHPDRETAEAQPASVAQAAMPAPSAVSRPRLVLRGVLGGPPWDAVIDGVPGRDGAVVIRAGQSLAGVTVRAVRRDTVFARGFDTTWALTMGRTW